MSIKAGFFRSKLARRIIGLFLISALVPILATAIVSFSFVNNLILENTHTQLQKAGKFYGMALLERLLFVENKLRNSIDSPTISNQQTARLVNLLANEIDRLVIYHHSGKTDLVMGTKQWLDTLPAIGPGDCTQPLPRLFSVSSNGSHNVFMCFSPFATHTDDPAYLVAEIRNTYLWGDKEALPFAANLCVVENFTAILFCSMPRTENMTQDSKAQFLNAIKTRSYWDSGDDTFLLARWELFLPSHFVTPSWSIIASQHESDILLPVTMFKKLYPLVVILSLLVVLLLSTTLIRKSLVPLEKLTKATRRVAKGHLEQKVDIRSGDEFENLAIAFNTMTSQLGKQLSVLKMLSEIDKLLLLNTDIDGLVNIIFKRIHEILPSDYFSIVIMDNDSATHGRLYYRKNKSTGQPAETRVSLAMEEVESLQGIHLFTKIEGNGKTERYASLFPAATLRTVYMFPANLNHKLASVILLGFENHSQLTADEIKQIMELVNRLAVWLATAERDARLYQQAHYDSLTGLPNRQLLYDRLGQEIIHASRGNHLVAVLFIDLDRFKHVNDTHGHAIGDQLLVLTARRIKKCVRKSDTVARLGGDEFTVILSVIREASRASTVAENVIRELSMPFVIDTHEIFISASIGITVYPQDGSNAEELLKNADAAMYRAKASGRSRHLFFEERMNVEELERTRLEQDLRYALEQNEFSLFYQPLIDFKSGKITGAEALLRWNHPRRGMVSPAVFIPLAEETGLIEPVGEFVLKTACKQYRTWLESGIKLERLAVNMSSRQFMQTDIIRQITQALELAKMPAHALELEITESLLIDERTDTLPILEQLHNMGISISIDDFGTGYSSLSYLKRLPVDTLKIDRSFVGDIPAVEDTKAIISSIIILAHTLNKHVIAEGIETVEQMEFLKSCNADSGQGYFFSEPLSADAFARVMTEQGLFVDASPCKD